MRGFQAFAIQTLAMGLVVAATGTQAWAISAVVWQGDVIVTKATGTCSAGTSERQKISTGTVLKSVLRPASVNDAPDRISFFHDSQAAMMLKMFDGLNYAGKTGAYKAYGVTWKAVKSTGVDGTYAAFTMSPAAPANDTAFIQVTGTINNFMFVKNCSVTFRGSFVQRPD